ncbi:MAG: hypothetical protein Q9178_006581 [Gyalolechia marmorata]
MATTNVLTWAEAALVDLVVQVVPRGDLQVYNKAIRLLQVQIRMSETRLHGLVKSLEQRRTETLIQLRTMDDSLRDAAALVEDWNETTQELIRKLNTSLDMFASFRTWLLAAYMAKEKTKTNQPLLVRFWEWYLDWSP